MAKTYREAEKYYLEQRKNNVPAFAARQALLDQGYDPDIVRQVHEKHGPKGLLIGGIVFGLIILFAILLYIGLNAPVNEGPVIPPDSNTSSEAPFVLQNTTEETLAESEDIYIYLDTAYLESILADDETTQCQALVLNDVNVCNDLYENKQGCKDS
jgi:hypothetical protein